MKRMDRILTAIREGKFKEGATAGQLAEHLGLDRANVSNDLNLLHKEGKLTKTNSRPVYFKAVEQGMEDRLQSLDRFGLKNPSLQVAIDQGKAAVLYPPKGLNTIILGETGVGKSMFAGLLHTFGTETGRFRAGDELVTFNCADYSNNPQLLLSHLFGVHKGAYTGAIEQPGLLEKSHDSILFLDEVHRLPPEGQEMFFKFLDNGTYRRLGETGQERQAKVMIICATSERPESALLQTFIRRIPMVITIPPLSERSDQERYQLVTDFIKAEALRLGKEITVSGNTLSAFLYYPCKNNIGQLKNDIQLSCAKAFADYVTGKKEKIQLNSTDLPPYIRLGLTAVNQKDTLTFNHRYYTFHPGGDSPSLPSVKQDQTIYGMIETKYSELIRLGIEENEINSRMDQNIEQYFDLYLNQVKQQIDTFDSLHIIDMKYIKLSETLIGLAEEKLQKSFSNKTTLGLALHVHTTLERLKAGKAIVNPKLNTLRTLHRQEFLVALECLRIIEENFSINLPIDEAGYLTMFLKSEDQWSPDASHEKVQIIVMMHGRSTASSMVDTVNQLLGEDFAQALDMPLDMNPEEAYESLKLKVKDTPPARGLLLLVDMGSLTTFGRKLRNDVGIEVETIPNASTAHVLESVRKAILGYSLSELAEAHRSEGTIIAPQEDFMTDHSAKDKSVIITACLTGSGSAKTIKHVLERYLSYDSSTLEIIPIMISDHQEASKVVQHLSIERNILCVISHFHFTDSYPLFSIEDVLNLTGIKGIQALIDHEQVYLSMQETLNHHLEKMDSRKVVPDIRSFLDALQPHLGIHLNKNDLIGIVLHLSCMLDRISSEAVTITYDERGSYIQNHPHMYTLIKDLFQPLEQKYAISIPDDEICYVMNFFEWGLQENTSLN